MKPPGLGLLLLAAILHALGQGAAAGRQGLAVHDSSNAANVGLFDEAGQRRHILPVGAHVRVHGLHTTVALNGREGAILSFDRSSGRYLVQILGRGPSMRIRPQNLEVVIPRQQARRPPRSGRASESAPEVYGGRVRRGSLVVLNGLVHVKALNGELGTIGSFDFKTRRYMVQLREGGPIRVRPVNLLLLVEGGGRGLAPASVRRLQQRVSQCQSQGRTASAERRLFADGALVALESAGAAEDRPAGQALRGVVLCFDTRVQQYLVALPNAMPQWITPERLHALAGAEPGADNSGTDERVDNSDAEPNSELPVGMTAGDEVSVTQAERSTSRRAGRRQGASPVWRVGSYARLRGLRAAARLNGKAALVTGFDKAANRYTVKLSGGELKRVRAVHLGPLQPEAAHDLKMAPKAEPLPSLTICNAYAATTPLQVFAASEGRVRGGHSRVQVARHLEFQACTDVKNLPQAATSLAFVAGKHEVAHLPLNGSLPQRGLEVTVFRASPDSKQASIDSRVVELSDIGNFHVNVVNAYAGSRSLELSMRQGRSVQQLPMGKSYRLSKEEMVELTLTDGLGQLRLSFQPRRSRSYCVVAVGLEGGEQEEEEGEEVWSVGLLAHEVGAWTMSEDLGDGGRQQGDEALSNDAAAGDATVPSQDGAFTQKPPSLVGRLRKQ